jgi:hypothetical protein
MKLILNIFFVFSTAFAAENADNIIKKINKNNEGFAYEEAIITMTLIDAYKKEAKRKLHGFVKEDTKLGNKSLVEFIEPFDVKGTKLLSHRFKDQDNSQWLYLPKLKRVKKLLSSQQSGSFMGSEFTYEDISGVESEKYKYKLLKEDNDSWVIESTPKNMSGYSKIIGTYSKSKLTPTYAEYFDRKNDLLKISKIDDLKKYKVQGKDIYKAGKITMTNVQTKKSSVLTWDDRKIGKPIPDNKFSPNAMER